MRAVESHLRELLQILGGRAAGVWRVSGDDLDQVAFTPGDGLDAEVAAAFAEATRRVSRRQAGLGIVRAWIERAPVVSRVSELPAEGAGSGHWLRRFGADRSIAVASMSPGGDVRGVVAVAVCGGEPSDEEVIRWLLEWADRFSAE